MHISTRSGCNKARNFALGLLASIGWVVNLRQDPAINHREKYLVNTDTLISTEYYFERGVSEYIHHKNNIE